MFFSQFKKPCNQPIKLNNFDEISKFSSNQVYLIPNNFKPEKFQNMKEISVKCKFENNLDDHFANKNDIACKFV